METDSFIVDLTVLSLWRALFFPSLELATAAKQNRVIRIRLDETAYFKTTTLLISLMIS